VGRLDRHRFLEALLKWLLLEHLVPLSAASAASSVGASRTA
jgi:hypothetical protein